MESEKQCLKNSAWRPNKSKVPFEKKSNKIHTKQNIPFKKRLKENENIYDHILKLFKTFSQLRM